jgi:hypothetical protein
VRERDNNHKEQLGRSYKKLLWLFEALLKLLSIAKLHAVLEGGSSETLQVSVQSKIEKERNASLLLISSSDASKPSKLRYVDDGYLRKLSVR